MLCEGGSWARVLDVYKRQAGFAGFTNCPGMKLFGISSASSLALAMAPFIPLVPSVRTSSAPDVYKRQEQACEGSRFAPAVWITPYIAADVLHQIKGLLVDNGFMGILKDRPFVLRNIVAFLVLKVLAGLEIDGVP